jgi:MFS family permease
MVTAFMLAMFVASLLVFRLSRRSGRRRVSDRQHGRSDGVRTVYKRSS